ncbi:hypothetical protein VE01_04168 [Pseudogymnoascus verrucosus]|uniref:AHC1-like C2H2 zinc-finger domain-containing protein n=1 Tax=Pseudogymnoascus verrucosus TaxID=342668 RepID=A0A1B8GLS0_9PEZI|nr:uncharacterized protein VE01_04168 [Pseudogymnoascus verrucosus]OBT96779.2 hypothetical protein VE01_04168 [Pseudogymnoascus verrucosus]
MRMFRFSSWISESRGGDEAVHGHNKLAGMEQPLDKDARDYSVQPVGATKRKLDDRDAPPLGVSACAAAAKRKKECDNNMGAGLSAPQAGEIEATATVPNRSKPGALARMREVIDHQLSLEVLMKHDELRRIDQELAKATVALDQLRRCHLIPFPVSLGSPEAMLTVSTGTGPSIPQARRTQPRMAAPFGVTEGPYSRHYASWLIPDPEFDGVQTGWGMLPGAAAGNNTAPGRTTRNSLALETPTTKPRRGAASSKKLQALPSGYPPPKETAGPLVLKRADGQWVKLVCLVCQRENFGSTQGFINHCRIAHHREFKSHEEAASQSGQPVEVDSVTGSIVGGDSSKPAPPTTNTPTGSSTLVHPLIRSVPYDRQTVNTLLERISEGTRMFYEGKLPGITSIPSVAPAAPSRKRSEPHDGFVASDSAPCLSRLLHRRGFGQNLDQLVEEVKTPTKRRRVVGTDGVSDSASDSDSEFEMDAPEAAVLSHDAPVNGEVAAVSATADAAAPMSTPQPQRHAPILPPGFARPGSSKGPSTTLRRPGMMPSNLYSTPGSPPTPASQHILRLPLMGPYDTISSSTSSDDIDVEMDAADLSPATASNKAPSLISDDGEYSYVEDGESSGAEESVEGGDEGEGEEEVEIEEVGVVRTGKGGARRKGGEVGFVRAVKGGK